MGEFGKVCVGTVKIGETEEHVAVKMTKKKSRGGGSFHENKCALKGLLSEIKILAYLGSHKHIAALKGAYTEKVKIGHLLVFLELCEVGSLQKYLHGLETKNHQTEGDRQNVQNEKVEDKLRSNILQDLERWAMEIADGMEYLASKKVKNLIASLHKLLLYDVGVYS